MHHLGRQFVFCQFAGIPGDFGIAEPVLGKARRVDLRAAALQDIGVGGAGVAQVLHVQRTVFVQQLGVLHGHGRARLPFDREPNPAGEILSKIHCRRPPGQRGQRLGPNVLDQANGRHGLAVHCRGRGLQERRGRPPRIVEAGAVPAGNLLARVIGLAVVQALLDNRACAPPPAFVGGDGLGCPVFIFDVQVQPGRARTGPPAVAHHESRRVRAFPEQSGHVISTVECPFPVHRVARVEHVVPHALPVEIQLVVTQARRVGPRARQRLRHLEFLAEQR